MRYIKKFLSKKEIWIIYCCFLIIVINLIFLGYSFGKNHLRVVPASGGGYSEGLIGMPKYINPLYSNISDSDNDLSKLLFSSLFKLDKNNKLIKDLVVDYDISSDEKIYSFIIRTDVKWHNNEPLTADDVIFTFNAIKDSRYKSFLYYTFQGVDIEKQNNNAIKFILSEPYAAFLDLLTFGILPQHLWSNITPESASLSELNLKPIGSGPYKFKSLIKNKAGNIKFYNLIINNDYYGLKPYIKNLTFKFFYDFEQMIDAFNTNVIDGISYLPENYHSKLTNLNSVALHKLNLPQITSIFFNQKNNPFLSDKSVRQALALAIDKNNIISNILQAQARLADGPILFHNFAYNQNLRKYRLNLEEADQLLNKAGWEIIKISPEDIIQSKKIQSSTSTATSTIKEAEQKLMLGAGSWRFNKKEKQYLIITLTTIETDHNIEIVNAIQKNWEDVGIKTKLNIISADQVQSKIIQPRNFEALLYGQIVGNDPDVYAFWHSSQIKETGLNLSNYNNPEVDQLLEDGRLILNTEKRIEKYMKFQEILADELPVIFLYSPIYTYVQKKIKGFDVKNILTPSDRFANIEEWYIKTRLIIKRN